MFKFFNEWNPTGVFFNMNVALLWRWIFVYGCIVLTNVNKPELLDKPGTCPREGVLPVQLVSEGHSIFDLNEMWTCQREKVLIYEASGAKKECKSCQAESQTPVKFSHGAEGFEGCPGTRFWYKPYSYLS